MWYKEKIIKLLNHLVVICWFFVLGIGIGIIGYSNNVTNNFFDNFKILFLAVSIFFIVFCLFVPKIELLPNFSLKKLFILFSSLFFGIFWYLKSLQITSPTHLLAQENGKYKFIDADVSQSTIIYGTIVSDPDVREDATYIVVKPHSIIPSPDKYTIRLDTSNTKVIIKKEYVSRVIDGDTFETKNGQKVRLLAVNAPEIGQPGADEATEFLKQKVLNKEVELIIQHDYRFDIYDRILAVVKIGDEIINKELLEKGLAEIYDDQNVKIIKKKKYGKKIELKGDTGLIRAKVLPTIGDYYLNISYGDYVEIDSPLLLPKKATNPAGFDYRKYLNARGIYAVTKTLRNPEDIEYQGIGKVNPVIKFAFWLRKKILLTIRKTVPYPQSAFLAGVTVRTRGGVPQKIKEQFQATGVAHVLALSGLHTSFIAALLLIVCNIFKIKSYLRFILTTIGLTIFVIMTGASPATIRAALMFIIGLFLYDILKLPLGNSARVTIAVAAAAILLFNPKLLPDASFVLSFMAVWSLIYVAPVVNQILLYTNSKIIHQFITFPLFTVICGMTIISLFGGIVQEVSLVRKIFPFLASVPSLESLFPKWFNIPTSRWLYKGEFFLLSVSLWLSGVIVHYLYSLSGKMLVKDMLREPVLRNLLQFVSAQVAIQLGMMWPLSSLYFYRFPISGFYANFLAIPLIGWIVQLSWLAGIVDLIFSFFGYLTKIKLFFDIGTNIALVINAFNNQLCQAFLGMAKTWGNFIPYPYVEMFSGRSLILWYGILGVIIFNDKIKTMFVKFKTQATIIFIIILVLVTSYFVYPYIRKQKEIKVIFLDVGFGNSVLIITPKKTVLIDTGSPRTVGWSAAESQISPTLTFYKIKNLDAVILSSLKPQCIGGVEYILKHFKTKKLYLPQNFQDCSNYTLYDFLDNMNLWYYKSNPYQYEVTSLYTENYKLSKFLNSYKGEVKIVSSEEVVFEEQVGNENVRLEIFQPQKIINTYDEIANNSLVIRLIVGKYKILFLSQASVELQNVLLTKYNDELKSDIMLVPGNGHVKYFNKDFVNYVSPKIVVCSYGWTNQRIGYFPSSFVSETQKMYEDMNIKFLRTDYFGAISFVFVKEKYYYTTGIDIKEHKLRLASGQQEM